MMSLPTPGQEKMVSVTTAKASVEPNSSPNTVTSGIEISLSTCRRRMVHSLCPLARANFTMSLSITSRVPARARRIISASLNSDRLSAGSSRCFRPSSVRKLQPMPNTSTVGPRLPAGSQPSHTEKVRMSTRPTQNVGTENPSTDTPIARRENGCSGL